jgi:hypothetical protein
MWDRLRQQIKIKCGGQIIVRTPAFSAKGRPAKGWEAKRKKIMYKVYVLKSEVSGKRYIGMTSDIEARLKTKSNKCGIV